jgi:chaperonin GroES
MSIQPLKSFKPLSERVVIKRESSPEELNGFYIPEKARETINRGHVVAIADDVTELAVGNYVLFGKYDGTINGKGYEIDGQEYLIMKENQVWAVLSNA